VVVVNDGSTDDTAAILEQYSRELPLHCVNHLLNRGLGETERDGFEYIARHCEPDDMIVRVEADNTHEPQYIFSLLSKLDEGFDMVNASRFQPGGGQVGVDSYRAFISRAANLFMRFVFRVAGIRDYSCGYRAYKARIIQDAVRIFGNYFIQLRGLGFTSTLEMIVKLNIMGCRFAEVPFVLRYDHKTSSSKMIGSLTTLGYFTMALLYHWPFGGWARHYRGLRYAYQKDPQKAVEQYGYQNMSRKTASRISF
jgi:dolichol-phosphate mannosyltransferase